MPTSLLTVTPLAASGISHVFDNIPYGPIAWFDASKISGIASGTSLSAWTDISGNGIHLTQASAVSQPTFQGNVQNGLPAVRFVAASKLNLVNNSFTAAQPHTRFLVAKTTNKVATYSLVGSTGAVEHTIFQDTSGRLTGFVNLSVVILGDSSATWNATCFIYNGSTSSGYLNGISTNTTASVATTSQVSLMVGASNNANFANADIAEIIDYGKALTTAEVQQVFNYLGPKWGISIT